MSTERKPMLSDDVVRFKNSPFHVRDFYEDLITSGKLRVVEDVDAIKKYRIDGSAYLSCSYCACEILDGEKYCDYCERLIKRP